MPPAKRASSSPKSGPTESTAKRAAGSPAARAAASSGAKEAATSSRKAADRTSAQTKSGAAKTARSGARGTAAAGKGTAAAGKGTAAAGKGTAAAGKGTAAAGKGTAAAGKGTTGTATTGKGTTGTATTGKGTTGTATTGKGTAAAAKSTATAAKSTATAAKGTAQNTRASANSAAGEPRNAGATDSIASVAEQLVKGSITPQDLVMLTRDRIRETLDDAAARGRVTRKDADELVTELVRRGRSQSDDLRAEIEALLGRVETATRRARSSVPVDRLVRGADRARRAAGVGPSFPIASYDELTAVQVRQRVTELAKPDLRKVLTYERKHANRKTVVQTIEKALG